MAKIFMVEDNPTMVATVTAELKKWQHQVVTVNNWQAVANEVATAQPDLILFDLTLPSFDGFYWIQEVRKSCQAPIIVISAADIDSNVMHAVAAGADDYLMKPFSLTVLLAKIQAQLRRQATDQQEGQVHWGSNQLNPLTGQLQSPRGTVQLSPTESAILQVLVHHLGQTVTKEQLLAWLWQGGKYLNENTLSVNVSRLRTKLASAGLDQTIRTERGVGYRMVDDHE